MNRRSAGRVKQRMKRARIRSLVRQGLRLSMAERVHNLAHQHEDEPAEQQQVTYAVQGHETDTVVQLSENPTHSLWVTQDSVERETMRGTEGQMRYRLKSKRETLPEGVTLSVRKIKVVA